jgi:hypothetical protein
MDIYYEFLVAAILIPTLMLVGLIAYMKYRKSDKDFLSGKKSNPV